MSGKKRVDLVAEGLSALVDEFTSSIKDLVNAGEETVITLTVGGGRAINAIVDATGKVTKVGIETTDYLIKNVKESAGQLVEHIRKKEE